MARAIALEHLQSFRFSLVDAGGDPLVGGDVFDFRGGANGGVGFAAIEGGEITAETEAVQEGNWPFPHHIVVRGTTGPLTLRRGILPRDSEFYNWFMACLYGYRFTARNLLLTALRKDGTEAKAWLLHKCIPIGVQPFSGFDAMSSEVLMAELTIQPEYIEELPISTE